MLVVQFAVGAHASHIAQAAANAGAQAGRLYHATNGDAQTAATTLLDQSAGTILANPAVAVTRTATAITVTVTGTASTVVPGLTLPIRASVTAPIDGPPPWPPTPSPSRQRHDPPQETQSVSPPG